MINEENISS